MSLVSAIRDLQDAPAPDFITRPAIAGLVSNYRRALRRDPGPGEAAFARDMATRMIAEHTDAANRQHYELPSRFFEIVLGPRLKYSSCLYPRPGMNLAEAEVAALRETSAHADLEDGQAVLEMGCGWGSLSLWMAEHYPASKITAVSNSRTQKLHIDAQARTRGLTNLTVVTADMNAFKTTQKFDRIVSVEMFEHMANWRALLTKAKGWLAPEGRMFIHVFTHKASPYRFEVTDTSDFIAQHFFTGGIMPSHGLIRQFPDLFAVEQEWVWNGKHYQRTANDWLANMDANAGEVAMLMHATYGEHAKLWTRRWRRFFLATAALFGDNGGEEWAVSHYRLKAA